MKITIEQKKQTEIDIELPAYYQWGTTKYKFLDATTAIEVKESATEFGIRKTDSLEFVIAEAIRVGKPITDEEFCEAFTRVGEKVKRELVKAMESDAWKQQEEEKSNDDPDIDPVDYDQRESFREEQHNLQQLK